MAIPRWFKWRYSLSVMYMTRFHEQDLAGALFEDISLRGATFNQVDLNDAQMRAVDFTGGIFVDRCSPRAGCAASSSLT